MSEHLRRMLELADQMFDMDNDPDQISVTDKDYEKLVQIHEATLSEKVDGDGPVAWILVIPTTKQIMDLFLAQELTEQQVLDETPVGAPYEAIYLCSALILTEYRRKGLAKTMTLDAIHRIQKDHPIKYLFYWPFTDEGKCLADAIARNLSLPLFER